jgi:hypothetical protein
VPDTLPLPLDLPAADPDRAPIVRSISSSERGGWPIFCRLLLWATRNAKGGAGR